MSPARLGWSFSWVILVAGVSAPLASTADGNSQEASAPEHLLARVQQRYREASDLRARFTQRTTPRPGGLTSVAEGSWFSRPPGLIRIEYASTGRLFVADGEALYWYLPRDNQVQVLAQSALDPSQTPLLYLAGAGNLKLDFRVSRANWRETLRPGNVQLRLDPVRQGARFSHLLLEIELDKAAVVRLAWSGLLGELTELRFRDVEFDVGLSGEAFRFVLPTDARVERLRD